MWSMCEEIGRMFSWLSITMHWEQLARERRNLERMREEGREDISSRDQDTMSCTNLSLNLPTTFWWASVR